MLIIFQDTYSLECPKTITKHTFTVFGSVFSSGVALESHVNLAYRNHTIPDSSGLGIISGQTSYALNILIMNDTFTGNLAYSSANMLVLVYDGVSSEMQITNSHFTNSSSIDGTKDGGVSYISGHKMPPYFTPLCKKNNDNTVASSLKIQRCTFTNNSGQWGSALLIKITYRTKIHIDNCTIQGDKGYSSLHLDVGFMFDTENRDSHFTRLGNVRLSNLEVADNYVMTGRLSVGVVKITLWKGSSSLLEAIEIINTTFAKNKGRRDAVVLNVIHIEYKNYSFQIIVRNSYFYYTKQEESHVATGFYHYNRPELPLVSLTEPGTVLLNGVHNVLISGCTFAYNQGSAIISRGSIIYFSGDTYFIGNQGEYGGALALYTERFHYTADHPAIHLSGPFISNFSNLFIMNPTQLFFYSNTHLYLEQNSATQRGGAIFVEDPPFHFYYMGYPCFYHVAQSNAHQDLKGLNISIKMKNNTAQVAGNSVYGGMQSGCGYAPNLHKYFNAFDSLFTISKPWTQSEFASNPHTLCVCSNEIIPNLDCTRSPIQMSVYPGQTFKLLAVVIGNPSNFHFHYSAVPALIHAEVSSSYIAKLGVRQSAQQLNNSCGELTFNISTIEPYVEILLTAELPIEIHYLLQHKSGKNSERTLKVDLTLCPLGFQLKGSVPRCECIDKLHNANCACSIDKQTILCPGGMWVGNHFNNVIAHTHCPFDFCTVKAVPIRLEAPDEQCAFRRSGILCGECQQHLSLALGTSQCMECSNIFLLLVIPFMLVGILLVLLLQLCNLTVSVGTINGLSYFANIITINHAIFFRNEKKTVLSVFIAWLNLDLGIQTCFYAQLDMYIKTWLQIAFPIYIWILVGAIIKISHHSVLMSRIAGSNAVSVLATLFLLSYAKLLRTIITVLSFTHLTYPDGTVSAVWLYDGNVPFLKGKHAALFVMALIFTLGFILPYTLLLLLSPCLQARSAYRGIRWINKLKPFLDAYHGPYKDKFRNWTGVMLVVRAVQFIIFAFNVQGDPSVNLLVIIICTCVHLVSCWNIGTVYKNQFLNILESYFLLSLGILAGGSLYARTGDAIIQKQEAITKSIVGTTFAVFLFVVIFHILKLSKPYYWNAISKLLNWRNKEEHPEQVDHEDILDNNNHCAPTVSYFELREPLDLLENNA